MAMATPAAREVAVRFGQSCRVRLAFRHVWSEQKSRPAIFLRKIAGVELAIVDVAVPMLRKTVAALLLVLVASPFTAPFATCDITSLFGRPVTVAPVQVQL